MNAVMETGKVKSFDLSAINVGPEESPLRLASASSDDGPALIIGDIHGHLDRFEALLKQEGLLDRCAPCQGTGMKSVFGSVSEWDTANCEKCEGDGWSRTDKPATIVLLGDVGHFGNGASPTGDLLTWIAAVRWADVILWGNHDRALVSPEHIFGGYQKPNPEVYHVIARARNEGKLKLAYATHGFLMTHAGLAKAFRDSRVDPEIKIDPYVFADWINTIEDQSQDPETAQAAQVGDMKYKLGTRDAISSMRGGWSSIGGILWRDISEKLYGGFRQVFGHSADHGKHDVRYCWENGNSRSNSGIPPQWEKKQSYCIDVGGKGDKPGDNCLAGIWLPDERIVRVDLS